MTFTDAKFHDKCPPVYILEGGNSMENEVNVLIEFLQTIEQNSNSTELNQSKELRTLFLIFEDLHSNVYVAE